ncbi:uncharacterized protein V1478_006121 [Vespula squamosa]|uniref:Uncharacterized protein n=1 Tax=Vespula squamosa TaxID=30214 RepID=A0ABD2B6Z8_VESSQ
MDTFEGRTSHCRRSSRNLVWYRSRRDKRDICVKNKRKMADRRRIGHTIARARKSRISPTTLVREVSDRWQKTATMIDGFTIARPPRASVFFPSCRGNPSSSSTIGIPPWKKI